MAGVGIKIGVSGQDRFRRAANRLDEAAHGGLKRRIVDAVRQEAQPALREVRQAWLGVDVTSSRGGGTKSTGLRARTAGATHISDRAGGVHFEVNGAEVGPYGRSLSFYLDGIGRWRHPVFGHDPWVQQYGQEVFSKTIRAHEQQWAAAIGRVLDDVARSIEG